MQQIVQQQPQECRFSALPGAAVEHTRQVFEASAYQQHYINPCFQYVLAGQLLGQLQQQCTQMAQKFAGAYELSTLQQQDAALVDGLWTFRWAAQLLGVSCQGPLRLLAKAACGKHCCGKHGMCLTLRAHQSVHERKARSARRASRQQCTMVCCSPHCLDSCAVPDLCCPMCFCLLLTNECGFSCLSAVERQESRLPGNDRAAHSGAPQRVRAQHIYRRADGLGA